MSGDDKREHQLVFILGGAVAVVTGLFRMVPKPDDGQPKCRTTQRAKIWRSIRSGRGRPGPAIADTEFVRMRTTRDQDHEVLLPLLRTFRDQRSLRRLANVERTARPPD